MNFINFLLLVVLQTSLIHSKRFQRDLPKCSTVIGVGQQLYKNGILSSQTVNRVMVSKKKDFKCIETSGTGKFNLSMNIYSDDSYTTFLSQKNQEDLVYNQPKIFLELKLNSDEEDFIIKLITCYATPDNNPQNVIQYKYIQNGCPLDSTILFYDGTNKKINRFSINTFRFVNYSSVFLFCNVGVCSKTSVDCHETQCNNNKNMLDINKDSSPHAKSVLSESENQDINYSVECHPKTMTLAIKKPLPSWHEIESFHLIDRSCRAIENSTHVFFKTPLHLCGTTKEKLTSGAFLFKNVLLETIEAYPIQRTSIMLKTYSCRYSNKYEASVSIAKISMKPAKNFRSMAFGNYNVTIDQYKDATFNEKKLDSVTFDSNADMYFQVSILGEVFNLALYLDECFGSPFYRSNNKEKFTFIERGCSKDKSLKFYKTADASKIRFSVKPFIFENSSRMFISCYVSACDAKDLNDNKCKKSCLE
ncbi:ZP domain-containing protein isoform X3 [Hydra vulgaris]|uniref:ZP domain-containing protein isoform X3 n=1 Tax=Hydra vulgaris TaxID=6087 RepID=A0ABM4CWK0_HYDVU